MESEDFQGPKKHQNENEESGYKVLEDMGIKRTKAIQIKITDTDNRHKHQIRGTKDLSEIKDIITSENVEYIDHHKKVLPSLIDVDMHSDIKEALCIKEKKFNKQKKMKFHDLGRKTTKEPKNKSDLAEKEKLRKTKTMSGKKSKATNLLSSTSNHLKSTKISSKVSTRFYKTDMCRS